MECLWLLLPLKKYEGDAGNVQLHRYLVKILEHFATRLLLFQLIKRTTCVTWGKKNCYKNTICKGSIVLIEEIALKTKNVEKNKCVQTLDVYFSNIFVTLLLVFVAEVGFRRWYFKLKFTPKSPKLILYHHFEQAANQEQLLGDYLLTELNQQSVLYNLKNCKTLLDFGCIHEAK